MKKKSLFFLLILIIVFLAILSTSCEGYLFADGAVYEWVDAPTGSKGEIYVDTDAPANRITKPIPGAGVSFSCYRPVTSDNTGAFHESTRVGPGGPYMIDIKVEKGGYFTLVGKLQHGGGVGGSQHSIFIFMVRE